VLCLPASGLASALTTQGAAADQTFSEQLLGWVVSALIGAFFALLVSFVVQERIAPRSSAKMRRQERWENDVYELWNLLHEQLERGIRRYAIAAGVVRMWEGLRIPQGIDQALYDEKMSELKEQRRDARVSVDAHLDRVSLMFDRVRWREPENDGWKLIQLHIYRYELLVASYLRIAARETTDLVDSDQAIEAALKEQEDERKALVDLLEPVVRSMVPPRPPRISVRPEDLVIHATRCTPTELGPYGAPRRRTSAALNHTDVSR
jgi:phosphate/sulfate permease